MHAHKTAAGLSVATIFLNRFSSFREKILRKAKNFPSVAKKTKTKSHTLLYYMLIFKDEQTPAKNKAER